MTTATNAKISALILAHVAAGQTLPQAYDAVLGQGAYAQLKNDLYYALRAKAGAA